MPERVRQALAEISATAAEFAERTTDYERLIDAVSRCGARLLKATCAVSLIDAGGALITPVAAHDEDPDIRARAQSLLFARPIDATLYASFTPAKSTMFAPVLDLEQVRPRLSDAGYAFMRDVGVTGMIVVLLRARGESLGLINMMRHRRDLPPFDEFDREIAEHIANLASLAVSNAREFRRAETEHAGRLVAEQALLQTAVLDKIVENIPHMVFVKEAVGLTFARMNRAGEQLIGVPREQLLGKSDRDLFPPEEAEFFIAKDRETLAADNVVDIAEEPIQTPRGVRWLHTKKVSIRDAGGQPRFLLGISEDITDRKRDLATLLAAKERAESSSRELETFSYSVAHDLRAPLRAIAGFGGALLEEYGDQLDDQGRAYIQRMASSVDRMGALIDALLKLSQVTRTGLTLAQVDLCELFRSSIGTLQRGEPERRVEVSCCGQLTAEGDPALLSVMFDNLCGNAWKFTSRVAQPRIELGAMELDRQKVAFVRDNGVGFDMRYVDKLFGVFQRLHTEREFAGTGIGLATVQRIAQRHRWRVWAEGAVGAGATFYFTLGEPA